MIALTLRQRLTLLVALAIVVPLAAVGAFVVDLVGDQVEDRAFERLQTTLDTADAIALARTEELRVQAEALARSIGRADGVPPGEVLDGSGESDSLGLVLAGSIDGIVIADRAGSVTDSRIRDPEFDPAFEGEPPGAVEILAGSPLVVSATADAPSGSVTVFEWLDSAWLRGIATSDITVTLLGAEEPSRPIAAAGAAGEALPAGSVAAGVFRYEVGRRARLAVARALPGAGDVTLVASAPAATDESQDMLLAILMAVLAALVVLVVLVGTVVSALITEPVQELVDAANTVAAGDLSPQVEPRGDRELVELGSAFNRMTESLRRHVDQLQSSRAEFQSAIGRLGDVLVATHDIGGIMAVVLEAATLTLRAETAVFYERIAMPARLRASASWTAGEGSSVVEPIELDGVGIAGTAAADLAPVVFPGLEYLDLAEPVVSSAIAVPVLSAGRLFGVLAVYGRVGQSLFSPDDVSTLQTLARQTEVAIGNVMLHDETRRQARTDSLTGLWNRREFELRTGEAIKESERFGESFGIVVVDIDDFKQVNDRYDHSTGDAALIWVANRLSQATREIDVVARWGGEEFILLLPRAGLAETTIVAERVVRMIGEEPMIDRARTIPMTASVGYAVRPSDGHTPVQLFRAADAALLEAKRTGKNRAIHAGSFGEAGDEAGER